MFKQSAFNKARCVFSQWTAEQTAQHMTINTIKYK